MLDDNRIHVKINPELTPVREERIDLNAEIDVAVQSRLTPLGVVGLVTLTIGVLLTAIGFTLLLLSYPPEAGITTAAFRASIERIVLLLAGGVIGLFVGTSMFFYGRTVLGIGKLDQFQTQEPIEARAGGAA